MGMCVHVHLCPHGDFVLPQPQHFRDRDLGLWSRPRPPDPLVGRAVSPRASEGTAAQSRLRGPRAITCSPHVPTPTKDLGRGGASSPGKEDFDANPYCKEGPQP